MYAIVEVLGKQYRVQEGGKVAVLQSCHLLGHPGILLIEVDGAHDGTVAAGLANPGDGSIEIRLVDLGQHLLAEECCNSLHFTGDSCVLVSQIRMVGTGIFAFKMRYS